jgi:hypothetical protein
MNKLAFEPTPIPEPIVLKKAERPKPQNRCLAW